MHHLRYPHLSQCRHDPFKSYPRLGRCPAEGVGSQSKKGGREVTPPPELACSRTPQCGTVLSVLCIVCTVYCLYCVLPVLCIACTVCCLYCSIIYCSNQTNTTQHIRNRIKYHPNTYITTSTQTILNTTYCQQVPPYHAQFYSNATLHHTKHPHLLRQLYIALLTTCDSSQIIAYYTHN